jgi:hypothetical protein
MCLFDKRMQTHTNAQGEDCDVLALTKSEALDVCAIHTPPSPASAASTQPSPDVYRPSKLPGQSTRRVADGTCRAESMEPFKQKEDDSMLACHSEQVDVSSGAMGNDSDASAMLSDACSADACEINSMCGHESYSEACSPRFGANNHPHADCDKSQEPRHHKEEHVLPPLTASTHDPSAGLTIHTAMNVGGARMDGFPELSQPASYNPASPEVLCSVNGGQMCEWHF